ncbi:MAG: alpha/beta fold hydrolase [Pseudomonadota bacterium]
MILPSAGAELEAEVSAPKKNSAPFLVLAHPHPQMGGDMHNKVIDTLFTRAIEKGWGALRFNFRGVGASSGTFDNGAGETDDVLSALLFASKFAERPYRTLTLAGYSFGSWMAAKAAATLPELGKLVLIAPPLRGMDFSPLQTVRHPKYVFAAGKDEFVSVAELEAWFAQLTPPKSLHLLEEADHQFIGCTSRLIRDVLRVVDAS